MKWNPRTSKAFRGLLMACLVLPFYFGVILWEHIPIGFEQSNPRISLGIALVLVFVLLRAISKWSMVEETILSDEKNAVPRRRRQRYSGWGFAALLLIICLTGFAFSGRQPVGQLDPMPLICAIGAAILIVAFVTARRAGF